MTIENWAKCGEHRNKIQEDDLAKEDLRNKILGANIIKINSDDSSTDEDDDDNKLFLYYLCNYNYYYY